MSEQDNYREYTTERLNKIIGVENVKKLTDEQIRELAIAIAYGLSDEELAVFAKPEYTPAQMDIICEGFDEDVPKEIIDMYATPEFSSGQMREILDGFYYNLEPEDIAKYAKIKYDSNAMHSMRIVLELGLEAKQAEEFTPAQIDALEHGLTYEISPSVLQNIADPKASPDEITAKIDDIIGEYEL